MRVRRLAGLIITVSATAWFFLSPTQLVESFAMRDKSGRPPNLVIETRSGIVHTLPQDHGGESVFGGNVYDGRINVDLRVNSNGIHRVYLLAALHPRPSRVLVLGLSGGSWTRVLSQFPGVDRIDVVEINQGYVNLIRRHEAVAPVLDDARVRIHIDDGRRWLVRNPAERYDMIVMNTSYYWRAYATNLLSREFMQLIKSRLAPGGIVAFNTTSSPDALWTAHVVFPFVRRYLNFAYAAEYDFTANVQPLSYRIWSIGPPDQPWLDRSRPADVKAVDDMLATRFLSPESVAKQYARPLEVITDDNMVTEFRFGRGGLFSTSSTQ